MSIRKNIQVLGVKAHKSAIIRTLNIKVKVLTVKAKRPPSV